MVGSRRLLEVILMTERRKCNYGKGRRQERTQRQYASKAEWEVWSNTMQSMHTYVNMHVDGHACVCAHTHTFHRPVC